MARITDFDPVTRLNAALEGRYRIESELGAGGMANVYLADDLKHERKVALKVLKPELAAVVGADRFLAEIKTTANLQHPHILPLFDSGEADSFLFYVMPFVDGETLQERINRDQQLPVEEAVRIAAAVADALAHAHESGVIHRDIKPANILMQKGQPSVADFGIALAVGAAGGGRLTETGLSVGTPFYMSPEQATGDQPPGPASDIYSLAAVLFEMLIGEPPYGGSSAQAVLGKIIQGAPVSATEIRKSVPLNLDGAIRKALEKLPADRFTNADGFKRALLDENFRYGEQGTSPSDRPVYARPAIAVALIAAAAFAGLITGRVLPNDGGISAPRMITSELTLGPDAPRHDLRQAQLSADGATIVYNTTDTRGTTALFVRETTEPSANLIPNTEGAWHFALAPRGDEVAFTGVAVGSLKLVSLSDGSVRTVADRAQGAPVWGDANIYFMNADFGISRVPIGGGDVEQLTAPTEDTTLRLPTDFLPEQRALLITESERGGERPRILTLTLPSMETSFVTEGSYARYVDGVLIYSGVDGSQIMGVTFDEGSLEMTGSEVVLHSGLSPTTQFLAAADFTVGALGDLVFAAGGSSARQTTAVWVDRAGVSSRIEPEWNVFPTVALTGLDLSQDGTRLAAASADDGANIEIWVKGLQGGPAQRLSFDPVINTRPFWGPDDTEVFYFHDAQGGSLGGELLAVSSDGSGQPREVLTDVGIGSGSWGAGQEWMLFRVGVPARESRDIYSLRSGDSEPEELIATPAAEVGPALSPDGRWLLYQSDRSGEDNIFVRPFPAVDEGLVQISLTGGSEPRWAASGSEIFYRNADGQMVAAQVGSGEPLRVTARNVLFDATPYWSDPASPQYDVSPDGERFIMLERAPGATPLMVTWNWLEMVKARLAAGNTSVR